MFQNKKIIELATLLEDLAALVSDLAKKQEKLESILVHDTGFCTEETLLDKYIGLQDDMELLHSKIDTMQRDKHTKKKG